MHWQRKILKHHAGILVFVRKFIERGLSFLAVRTLKIAEFHDRNRGRCRPTGGSVDAFFQVSAGSIVGMRAEGQNLSRDRVFAVFPRLYERRSQRAGTLSGGEQQMLAIGRSLMAEPRLLILDEPSLGLSPLLVEEMFGLMQRINAEGVTLLLVEQNVVQSLEVAQRAYVLENGVIVLEGSAADIRNDPNLKRAYLGM